MSIFMDIGSLISENRLKAFKHYVRAWKGQDPGTVKVDGELYSYTTKRGIKKRFKATNKPTPLKVEGFYFEPVPDGKGK